MEWLMVCILEGRGLDVVKAIPPYILMNYK